MVVFMAQARVCIESTRPCAACTRAASSVSLTAPLQSSCTHSAAAREAFSPPPWPPRPSATTAQSAPPRSMNARQSSLYGRPPVSV